MKISKKQEKKLVQAAIEGMGKAFTGTNKSSDMRFGGTLYHPEMQ